MMTYTEIFVNKARVDKTKWARFFDETLKLTKTLQLKDIETVSKYYVDYRRLVDCIEIKNYNGTNSNAYRVLFSQKTNQKMEEFVLYRDLDAYKEDEIRFSLSEENLMLGKIIEFLRTDFYYVTTCLEYIKCEESLKKVIDESKIIKKLKNIQSRFNLEFKDFLKLPTPIKELFFIFKLEGLSVDKKVWNFIFSNIDNEKISIPYSLVKSDNSIQEMSGYILSDKSRFDYFLNYSH